MIWLKGCPKCSGDMHYDPLVEEYVCLQCGLAVDRPPPNQGEQPLRPLAASIAPSLAGLPAGEPGQTAKETPRRGRKSR
jgi:hypothetical protein